MIHITITGTGTDVGKSVIASGLTRLLSRQGPTLAFKPYETGVDGVDNVDDGGIDAALLRKAANDPAFRLRSRYRLDLPIAPAAAVLEDRAAPSSSTLIAEEILIHAQGKHTLVEGAGGLMVPLNGTETFLDFALKLAFPVILVTPDCLGTLSHTLCAWRVAQAAGLNVCAVILNRREERGEADISQRTNLAVLESFGLPLIRFGPVDPNNMDQLADGLAKTSLLRRIADSQIYDLDDR